MSRTLTTTPRQDGYFMPAEWSRHTRCWMGFPFRRDLWRMGGVPAMRAFITTAETIARFEPVTMCVPPDVYRFAADLIPPAIRVIELSANDSWLRDSGPTFVVNNAGDVRGVDWKFNGWGGERGGLNHAWDLDDLHAQKILRLEQIDRYRADFVLEGGSIHVDGAGTLLTTEECLLNINRNPQLGRAELEQQLQDYLGIQHIIWLKRGVYLDETDGHIDNMACFVRPGVVVVAWTDDQAHPQYDRSSEAYEVLRSARDAQGRPLEVHKLHIPDPIMITEAMLDGLLYDPQTTQATVDAPAPASYVNFYLAGSGNVGSGSAGSSQGGVIVPTFDDRHDSAALQTLQGLFPDRSVVGVPGREILSGGGNIHCITQQQPG